MAGERGVELATAYVSLVASTGSLSRSVRSEYASVQRESRRAGARSGDEFASGMQSSIRSRASSIFTPLKIGAGILLAGATAAGKFGLSVAAGNEQAKISFETMLGSAKKANVFLGKLQAFAAKTPFEFPELQKAAGSLISAGVEANKVIPIMTTLGDVTSGMGTGSEGVQRATIALQQMNAAGRITAEDLNQLRDAGVPVYDLLAAATGRSKKAVADLAQKGKLGAKDLSQLMKALESGKGLERFNGLMEKQSQSLTGMVSTLKDTLGQGLATAVAPALPLIKQGIGAASEYIAALMPKLAVGVAAAVEKMPMAIERLKAMGAGISGLWKLLKDGDYTGNLSRAFGWEEDSPVVDKILDIRDAIVQFVDQIKGKGNMATVNDLFAKLPGLITSISSSMPALNTVVDVASGVFKFLGEHMDLVQAAIPYLIAGFAAYKALQVANNAVGRESIIGFGLQLASTVALTTSNFALAASQRSVTVSQVATTAATDAGRLARLKDTAANGLATVKGLALAAAQKVITAGQWLLNAALLANPIGLVIGALVLLGGALYLAWTKSETFRNIVLGAWDKIKTGVKTAVDWLAKTIPPIWDKILNGISSAVDRVMQFVQENIIDKINGLFTFLHIPLHISPVWKPNNVGSGMVHAGHGLYEQGGFTGWGGKSEPAGIVHGREWVIPADATLRLMKQQPGLLQALSGYAGGGYVWPVNARPSFPWGRYPSGSIHRAYDLAVPSGTPVKNPYAGTVIRDGWDSTGYGVHVRVAHENGRGYSILGHMTREIVNVGQRIAQNQIVGYSGSTGRSTGPHVHWATRWNPYSDASAFDPMKFGVAGGGGGFIGFLADQLRDRVKDLIGGAASGLSKFGWAGSLLGAVLSRLGGGLVDRAASLFGADSGGGDIGVASFDNGGWLPPNSWTLAHNGLDYPEPVGDVGRGGGDYYHFEIDAKDLQGLRELEEFVKYARRRARQGNPTAVPAGRP